MPVPNLGPRAPPGPPTRMPPGAGPGMKPGDASPWGNQPLQGRSWGDDPMTPSNPWDDKQRGDMGGMSASSGNGMPDLWRKPMRTSPSWEDSAPGGDMRGWGGNGGGNRPQFTKETIWSSKQFRVLMDMNFRKEEAETALRTTNMQLEDAIDLLNNMNRGQMPGGNRGGMPPSADSGFGGPRGGGDPSYDMRFPNPGAGMPYPPGVDGLAPPGSANPSLQNTSRGNMNPALVQQMTMMSGGGGGPPRPPQSGGTPSTSQLRLLVQQIQMAVQAGHLNAQILNQPLAPQTLLLLNQLLQQIKLLQQCKSQQQQCMTSRGGQNNQGALLALSVQITKHNQNITNLQNQITVQQAQYLKSQQPASSMAALPPQPADPAELNLNLSNLSLTADQQQAAAAQQHQASQGSKLNKWIKNDNSDDFSRAPGSSKSSTSQPSPNVLLEGGSTWSNGNNGAVSGGGSGWPDSNDKNSNNNATDDTDFGIPEFVPGKAWKGSSLKDPSEDPTLTPGSVAANPLLHSQPHNDMKSSSSMIMSSQSGAAANSSAVENSLGLTSTTWSFGNSAGGAKDMMSNGGGVGGWGSGLPPSSSTSNLTTMGQDLWGMGPRGGKPSGMSGWPSAAGGGGMSNGWSNGSNMPGAGGSAWLLLKNLTAQIDGSTLRTLCMQHGPLNNFQLFLTHGIALAKYSNGSEAKKVTFFS